MRFSLQNEVIIVQKLRKNAFLCPYTCVYGFFFVILHASFVIMI